ncbi:MAG: hypothetical protein JSS49_14675 [Planctomycetes bacterium]|nr:hypothetical protein [Planctomycetota bacterium]
MTTANLPGRSGLIPLEYYSPTKASLRTSAATMDPGTSIPNSLSVALDAVEKPTSFGGIPAEPQLMDRADLTLFAPFDEPGEVACNIDLRGAFEFEDGCTGVLFVRAGGKSFTREFHGKPNDFTCRFKFVHTLNAGLNIYVEILVERDLTKKRLPGGMFSVDSIDFEIKPVKSSAKKKATGK